MGTLSPDYAVCGTGAQQSPLDIVGAIPADLPPLRPDWPGADVGLVNNGHTIQGNVPPGLATVCGTRRFELLQFHFHAPGEHLVDGRAFPAELHFVHRDGVDGGLAVLAVLLVAGGRNPLLARLATAFPTEVGGTASLGGVHLAELLPPALAYWTYAGSLTTPPCSETVAWFVIREPLPVAESDIAAFARLYPASARPVAALGRRFILASR